MNMAMVSLCILIGAVCTSYSDELRAAGKCNIKEPTTLLDRDSIMSVTLKNSDLQIVCKLYSGRFVDNYALSAIPWISNLGGRKLGIAYHAAFFDKDDQLVASISQSADIPLDASGYQLGSSVAFIPKNVVPKITSYKIVIYTSAVTSQQE